MSNNTPSILSAILTIVLLIVLAVLSIFTQMIALNSVSEKQGVTAMGISLVFQSVGAILAAVFAWRSTGFVIAKFKWNKILAVAVAVAGGTLLGGLISFISIMIAIPLAGIR